LQGQTAADDILLDMAADCVGPEGALKRWAGDRWAKSKKIRNLDGAFIAFLKAWTKRRGDCGPEGFTLSRDMIVS
jgi:hypothetical protein